MNEPVVNRVEAGSAAERASTPSGPARVLRRMLRQPVTVAAVAFVLLTVFVGAAAPLLAPYEPRTPDYAAVLKGPSSAHLLGTDDLGRDTLSRLIHGARLTLLVAFGSVGVGMVVGVPLGLLLGYRGGWWDRLGSRALDISDALPGILVGFAVIAILGASLTNLMIAIGSLFCMGFARMTRAVTLAERERLYVDAARVAGLRASEILFRQVLPNLVGPLTVQVVVFLGGAIMIESGLSFLGLGLDPNEPTWGGMLSAAAATQAQQPLLPFPPGLAIIAGVLAFNLIGDGLSDALTGGHRKRVRRRSPRGRTASRSAASAGSSAASAENPVASAENGRGKWRLGPLRHLSGPTSDRQIHRMTPRPLPPAGRPACDDAGRSRLSTGPDPAETTEPGGVLDIRGVTVELETPAGGSVPLIQDVWLSVGRAEVVGLLGESGSGKSMLARATLGLLPPATRLAGGSLRLDGQEIAGLDERQLRAVRGRGLAVVFQDPVASLSPVHTVGRQLSEPLRTHLGMSRATARDRAAELLHRVGVEDPKRRLDDYPHQFSGGMAQRVAIAMALAAEPRLLIADEATSALDVTTQSQVLDLLLDLRDEFDMAILVITHDLGVVAETCDRAAVMYAGQIVEVNDVRTLFDRPRHPYTAALLAANPSSDGEVRRLPTIPGRVPLAGEWPSGCHFASRCEYSRDGCTEHPVPLADDVRCLRAPELTLEVSER